jgi:molybdopterin-synthase adenylyltransferase
MKYQINPSATLLVKEKGEMIVVRFLLDASRNLHAFEMSPIGEQILTRMYEVVSDEDLLTEFSLGSEELEQFLAPLITSGLILSEENFTNRNALGERNIRTVEFFRSFASVERPTIELVEKLMNSTILVLGLGGIGTWVVEMFARMGIRKLILVDPDTVEESNIPRQAMFTRLSVGLLKTEAAKAFCEAVSENTEVQTFSEQMTDPESLFLKLSEVDLVINCADKPDVDFTNALVTHACFKADIPHILCGGYDGHLSSLGQTVIPGETSCWFCFADSGICEDLLDGFRIVDRTSNQQIGGTICPVGAYVASFQVQEAVRILTGCSAPVMINRKAEIDFTNLSQSFVNIPKLKTCKLCGNENYSN